MGGPGNFNGFNNNYNYDPRGYNPYYAQLMEARSREKHAMLINCSKLGALLILYNICQYVYVYLYYIIAASVHDGALHLMPWEAVDYLRQHESLVRSSTFSMGGNLTVVALSLMTVLLVAAFPMHVSLRPMLKPNKTHVKNGAKWFPMCITLNIAVSIVVSIITNMLSAAGVTVPEADFSFRSPSTTALVLQFLYVIAFGPLAEELLYRGLILTLLKPFGKKLAVFFSALIFGLMHGNIPQAASAFATALVWGAIAVSCDSIVPTIVIHILNNIFASYNDFAEVLKWPYATEIFAALEIVLLFAGVFVICAFGWQLLFKDKKYAMTGGQRCAAVVTNVPMALYLLYLVFEIVKAIWQVNS